MYLAQGILMPDYREQLDVLIVCPGCSLVGVATWEESGRGDRSRGSERNLLHLSAGFHAESEHTLSGDPVIVCENCNTIQKD